MIPQEARLESSEAADLLARTEKGETLTDVEVWRATQFSFQLLPRSIFNSNILQLHHSDKMVEKIYVTYNEAS